MSIIIRTKKVVAWMLLIAMSMAVVPSQGFAETTLTSPSSITIEDQQKKRVEVLPLQNAGQYILKDAEQKLYWMDANEQVFKIWDEPILGLQIVQGQVYWLNQKDKKLYEWNGNFASAQLLKQLPEQTIHFFVGDKIYYSTVDGIYAIDGSNQPQVIFAGEAHQIQVFNKNIYFINGAGAIFEMKENLPAKLLASGPYTQYQLGSDAMFAFNQATGKLDKISLADGKTTTIYHSGIRFFDIDQDHIYFILDNNTESLNLIQKDLKGSYTFVQVDKLMDINVSQGQVTLLTQSGHFIEGKADLGGLLVKESLKSRKLLISGVFEEAVKEPPVTVPPVVTPVTPPVVAPITPPVVTPVTPTKPSALLWNFGDKYTDIEGVLTFRGGNYRQNAAYGNVKTPIKGIQKMWQASIPSTGSMWGGGSGWTGQPLLIKWPRDTKKFMNIAQNYRNDDAFVEVIQASLNGTVNFFDLKTGKRTRPVIKIGNSIKGTPSLDSTGLPILYVGDGIKESNRIGFRLFNLINQKEIHFENGFNSKAPRRWPAFDGSALFTPDGKYLLVGGENGLMYQMKLNAVFNPKNGALSIAPKVTTVSSAYSKGKYVAQSRLGMENSAAAYKDLLFISDNSGYIRCYNSKMAEVWRYKNLDDTDASIGIEVENGRPMLYSGCEVDHQGKEGNSRIIKLDGLTGKVVWSRTFKCYSLFGESPSNGGMVSSPIIGKGQMSDRIVLTLCRTPKLTSGLMMALDKKTGKTIWQYQMPTYAWPSPVAVYDELGKAYIFQNDRLGNLRIVDGASGKLISAQKIDSYLEASPVVYNNLMVFTSRTGKMYCFKLI